MRRPRPAATLTGKLHLFASRSTRRKIRQQHAIAARCWMFAALAVVMSITQAGAHGFGQRYDLPLPLSLYLFGGAAVVVVSFVVVGLFVRRTPPARTLSRVDLFDYPLGKVVAALGAPLKLIALALFA